MIRDLVKTTAPGRDSGAHQSDASRLAPLLGLAARLVLGGAFLLAGLLKLGRPLTSARAVQAYEIFPFDVAAAIGHALPAAEIIIGALLVLGLFTRPAALAGALLMLAFVAGIASAWARGLAIDCGCFGGGGAIAASQTSYGADIARDLLFVACGAWLVARPRTPLSLDARIDRGKTDRGKTA